MSEPPATGRTRKPTIMVKAGPLTIGGGAPVSVQSMLNVPTEDTGAALEQIHTLHRAGAALVRLALRDESALPSLAELVKRSPVPLCADIHFNHRLALGAIDAGVAKIRLNPGNITGRDRVVEVVRAASGAGVPIRIGVNGGSIDRKKYPYPTAEALVDSALGHIAILEELGFTRIVVSIKTSDVFETIRANEMMSGLREYPLHLGLTEAGYGLSCVVQSSVVIGHLLMKGIGDTIRVSMTGDPVDEVYAGIKILETTGDMRSLLRIISCPTCGRTSRKVDLLQTARAIEERAGARLNGVLAAKGISLTAAVMGCEVNGPGEASHADAGLAGTPDGRMLLFSKGKKIGLVAYERAVDALLDELIKIAGERLPSAQK